MRAFAASNQLGTCLWCGRKLRHGNYVQAVTEAFTPKKCEHCGSNKIIADGGSLFCGECQRSVRNRRNKIVARERRFEKPGDYGDGHFCGLRCGYQWGVAFADTGKRFNPAKPES